LKLQVSAFFQLRPNLEICLIHPSSGWKYILFRYVTTVKQVSVVVFNYYFFFRMSLRDATQ